MLSGTDSLTLNKSVKPKAENFRKIIIFFVYTLGKVLTLHFQHLTTAMIIL